MPFSDHKDIYAMNENQLAIFRRRKVGFVFQSYNLIPVLNVCEKILSDLDYDYS